MAFENENNSQPLMADHSMMQTLRSLYQGSIPEERMIPIALEATRKKERLSSTPFYANRAKDYPRNSSQKCENAYWIRLAISYQGTD